MFGQNKKQLSGDLLLSAVGRTRRELAAVENEYNAALENIRLRYRARLDSARDSVKQAEEDYTAWHEQNRDDIGDRYECREGTAYWRRKPPRVDMPTRRAEKLALIDMMQRREEFAGYLRTVVEVDKDAVRLEENPERLDALRELEDFGLVVVTTDEVLVITPA